MRLIKGLLAAAIAASLLLVPAGVLANSRDRDHDRMADKWEKRHHLNVHANDARKDPDHDGLRNLSEFRHHTDPRKADTDDDGIDDRHDLDDDELSGTIASFTNGVLTIQLAGDRTVSGTVNDATVIECDDDDDAGRTATASHDGSDDKSGPGSGDGGDDDDDEDEDRCTTADLTPGTRVHEAKLMKATDGSSVFTKIELVPAA